MSRRVVIIGASDLFEVVEAGLPGYRIAGYAEPEEKAVGIRSRFSWLGTDQQVLNDPALADAEFVVGIGDNRRRRQVVEHLLAAGRGLPSVVHPQATVFASARLGPGTIICPGAVVSADVRAGLSTLATYGALLGHEVTVGNFCFLAPGAKVLGGAVLGDDVVLGANAVVLAGVRIDDKAKLSAGTVANRNVSSGVSVLLRQQTRMLGP